MSDLYISKEKFLKLMNKMYNDLCFEEDLNRMCSDKQLIEGFINVYDSYMSETIELLHLIFGKADADHWIEYYCYELDFGRNYKPGAIQADDGIDIPLKTPEDLWNLLVENVEELERAD